jgi:hypothetical protein
MILYVCIHTHTHTHTHIHIHIPSPQALHREGPCLNNKGAQWAVCGRKLLGPGEQKQRCTFLPEKIALWVASQELPWSAYDPHWCWPDPHWRTCDHQKWGWRPMRRPIRRPMRDQGKFTGTEQGGHREWGIVALTNSRLHFQPCQRLPPVKTSGQNPVFVHNYKL